MAQRNRMEIMQETADKVQLSADYDMRALDMCELAAFAEKDPCEAICLAFKYGYAKGGRAAKAGKYIERRA